MLPCRRRRTGRLRRPFRRALRRPLGQNRPERHGSRELRPDHPGIRRPFRPNFPRFRRFPHQGRLAGRHRPHHRRVVADRQQFQRLRQRRFRGSRGIERRVDPPCPGSQRAQHERVGKGPAEIRWRPGHGVPACRRRRSADRRRAVPEFRRLELPEFVQQQRAGLGRDVRENHLQSAHDVAHGRNRRFQVRRRQRQQQGHRNLQRQRRGNQPAGGTIRAPAIQQRSHRRHRHHRPDQRPRRKPVLDRQPSRHADERLPARRGHSHRRRPEVADQRTDVQRRRRDRVAPGRRRRPHRGSRRPSRHQRRPFGLAPRDDRPHAPPQAYRFLGDNQRAVQLLFPGGMDAWIQRRSFGTGHPLLFHRRS